MLHFPCIHYVPCVMELVSLCSLRDGVGFIMFLVWWSWFHYVPCVMELVSLCSLCDGVGFIMFLVWWSWFHYVPCVMELVSLCSLRDKVKHFMVPLPCTYSVPCSDLMTSLHTPELLMELKMLFASLIILQQFSKHLCHSWAYLSEPYNNCNIMV